MRAAARAVLSAPRWLVPTVGHGLTLAGAVVLFACAVASFTSLSCQPPRRFVYPRRPAPPVQWSAKPAATVRVSLAEEAESLVVSTSSDAEWYAVGGDADFPLALPGLEGHGPWVLTSMGGMLAVGDQPTGWRRLLLWPAGNRPTFGLGDERYRGGLLIEAGGGAGLRAVELVSMEDYLRSVVGSEMPSKWPPDALKAQAVAARTYAAYRLHPAGHARPYLTRVDLAYKGVAGENHEADRAVEETAGVVMTYKGRLFPAYFHSTCGGATTSAAHVWAELPIEPLKGVTCTWCAPSPYYRWTVSIPAADVAAALADLGVQGVSSIRVEGVDGAGYAQDVLINGTLRLSAASFRLTVGPNLLRSTAFSVRRDRYAFQFSGRGLSLIHI